MIRRWVLALVLALASPSSCVSRGTPRERPSSQLLSSNAAECPISVAVFNNDLYVLTVAPREGGVTATVLRSTPAGIRRIAHENATRRDAVSGFVDTPDGPAFAIASPTGIQVHVVGADSARALPRGAVPLGREQLVPAIALATDPTRGFDVLANFGAEFGTHRLHTRDVGESVALTPQRQDAFAHPAVSVVGRTVVAVQERRAGSFERDGGEVGVLETVAFEPRHSAPHEPEPLSITERERGIVGARIAALENGDAAIAYRAASGVKLVFAGLELIRSRPAFRARGAPVRLDDDPVPGDPALGAPDVVSLPGGGAVVTWLESRGGRQALVVRRVTSVGALGPAMRAELGPPRPGVRVRVARTGDRVLVATDGGGSLAAFDVLTRGADALTVRRVPLQGAVPEARLAGLLGGDDLLLASAVHQGDHTDVSLFRVGGNGGLPARVQTQTVVSDLQDIARVGHGAVVLAGRTSRGILLTRAGEGEEGLYVIDSHGDDFAVAGSTTVDRIWVADAGGTGRTDFGPAHSVILHSFIGMLEDGPRTETWTGVVPWAAFGRMTLDAIAIRNGPRQEPMWVTTWSAGIGRRDEGCMAGAFVAMHRLADDHPMPLSSEAEASAWPGALSLVDPALRTCSDRIGNVVWSGSAFALTLLGPRVGARWVLGSVETRSVRSIPLPNAEPSGPTPGVARGGVVAWVARIGDVARVRVQRFTPDGRAAGHEVELPTPPARSVTEPLIVAAETSRRYAVAYAGVGGPVLAQVDLDP